MITISNNKTKIGVIGVWHLGCVVAASLANAGYEVTGTDFDKKILKNLKNGKAPLYEPELDQLIKKNIKNGVLKLDSSFQQTLAESDFIFLTFDTPVNNQDQLDLSIIYKACNLIAKFAPQKFILVIMSQIPVGTTKKIKELILNKNCRLSFDIVYNPENLRLGSAIESFMKPDRIVFGIEKESVKHKIEKLYSFIKAPKIYMDLEGAEMVKHAINAYLANSISFINEMANLCEVLNIDIRNVAKGMKSDKRIGQYAFLSPGLGFAGGTLGRDLQTLKNFGKNFEMKTPLIDAIISVNQNRQTRLLKKIKDIFSSLKNIKIGILGLTYKAGTNTLRRSVAIEISKKLIQKGATINAFDPMIKNKIKNAEQINVSDDPYQIAKNADLLILMTDWPEFKNLNFKRIKTLMRQSNIIDARNFLDDKMLKKLSFNYYGIGIKNVQ